MKNSKSVTSRIIGADKDGFYTLSNRVGLFSRGESPSINRYDTNNSLTFSKQLIIPVPGKSNVSFEFQDIRYLNGQLILFTSYLNKENNTYFSFASRVNPDGTVSGDMVELGRMEVASKRKVADYDFILSTDSSKILVFQHRPYEKNSPERFDMKVVDNTLQPLYTKSVEMPYKDNEVSIQKYIVDNNGNTYVLMMVDKSKAEKKAKTQQYYYKIMAYFHKEDQLKEYDLTLGDKFITDASFVLDNDQNLLVGGFYSDSKKMQVGGTFYLRIDAGTKKVLKASSKDFSPAFLANFMSERKAKKDDAGIGHLKMRQLLPRPDGSIVMAAEQHWVQIVTTTDPRTGVTRTTHHYYNNDLVFVNIAPEGEISWITHVPKKQHTINDGGYYNSYSFLIEKDNRMRILYNDNAKNLTVTDPKKLKPMMRKDKAVTTLVTLRPDGNFDRTPLFPAKESKTIVMPSFYLRGHNSMIIYSQKGKDFRFGRITFS